MFQLKYESIIHNNASSSEKWSGLKLIRREICTDQALFTPLSQNSSKQIYGWILMRETTGDGFFSTGGSAIMDYGLVY